MSITGWVLMGAIWILCFSVHTRAHKLKLPWSCYEECLQHTLDLSNKLSARRVLAGLGLGHLQDEPKDITEKMLTLEGQEQLGLMPLVEEDRDGMKRLIRVARFSTSVVFPTLFFVFAPLVIVVKLTNSGRRDPSIARKAVWQVASGQVQKDRL